MATIAQALHKEGVNEGILIGKARGEAIGEARGEARGKLEGKLELIKMMLKNGNSVQQISALTGLQVSQIQKLIS